MVRWVVTRLPAVTVNYDLNGNGLLDLNFPYTAEMQAIIAAAGNSSYDHNIFLVANSNPIGLTGIMAPNRYGFVFAALSPLPYQTTAHELGHGAFSFMHTPSDMQNLMFNVVGPYERLRKDQWDQVPR